MQIKAIIFDIDGVLADSREAVVFNTKELLHEFGFAVDGAKVENMSSAHSADSVLIGLAPSLADDGELLGKMLKRLSRLSAENLHLIKPTEIAGKIPQFAKKYELAVASNRKASARMVLEKLGILHHFRIVMTSADAPHKPSPMMVELAVRGLGIEPHEALFVGDNKEDMLAGEGAGVRTLMLDGLSKSECGKFIGEYLYARK